jgi:hypothetical protein
MLGRLPDLPPNARGAGADGVRASSPRKRSGYVIRGPERGG